MSNKTISLKRRIHGGFALMVILFVISAIATIVILNTEKKKRAHISNVTDPSLDALHEFRKLMRESMMFTSNWIFIRSADTDKKALQDIHQSQYPALKKQLLTLSAQWYQQDAADSLRQLMVRFEEVIKDEVMIMDLLQTFNDYNDPTKKFAAEEQLESTVIPKIKILSVSLHTIMQKGKDRKAVEGAKLQDAAVFLRTLILVLAVTTIGLAIFFSVYLGRKILRPIRKIQAIVTELGRGVTKPIELSSTGDEVGQMVRAVNNLSTKLSHTANFAHEIGNGNFDSAYEPLSNEDTLGKALLAMRDNLKVNEEHLSNQNRELERKNKELEQFVYIASHDLQEPLRTCSSFVDIFQQQYKGQLTGHGDKYINYIVQSTERMKVLINDLLDYSRIGNKKELELIDCNHVLQEVTADLGKKIEEENASIAIEPLPQIKGYRTEIKQLFQNLIVNAIKFKKKDTRPEVKVTANKKQGQWNFAVADNGIGIPEEHKERIFVIFQRLHTRTEYEGSGIGLAHCKKIVGLHGGQIWIDSILGEGTTFHFNIPEIKCQ